jgi:N-acetyl-anhydromuramyl-L-alanine amidase AmpD
VVLWCDPGGYNGYLPSATTQPSVLFGSRDDLLSGDELARAKVSGWDLPLLQAKVQQFVIHYDAAGTSRECFHLLHDKRGLSVHFLLDLDGTIYQTLDLRERAWHATTANGRSIGIEIANRGAVPTPTLLAEWYARDAGPGGALRITFPARIGQTGILTPNFVGRPATDHIIRGMVQGQLLYQYDLTKQQYQALAHLTAAICQALPRVECDYPRDAAGHLITSKLPDDVLARYCGLLGHYHIQRDKQDPGPAFDWDRVVDGARQLMAQQRGQIQ